MFVETGRPKAKNNTGQRDIRDLQATTTHTEKRMNQPNKQEKGKKNQRGQTMMMSPIFSYFFFDKSGSVATDTVSRTKKKKTRANNRQYNKTHPKKKIFEFPNIVLFCFSTCYSLFLFILPTQKIASGKLNHRISLNHLLSYSSFLFF
jgi:hypothetical protein